MGRVLKPHGLKGEIRALPINSRLQEKGQGSVLIFKRKNRVLEYKVEAIKKGGKFLIIKLYEINDINQAEKLRGYEIYEAGKVIDSSWEGKEVFSGERLIGTIVGRWEIPMNPILIVKTSDGREILIPERFCNNKGNFVEASLPEGLEEI